MLSPPCLMCLCAAASAQSQTVWRCGADGRSYSATPCADGRPVAVADPRSDGDRAAAMAVVQRERQAIARLADERREREWEAVQRGLGPAGIQPLPLKQASKGKVAKGPHRQRKGGAPGGQSAPRYAGAKAPG